MLCVVSSYARILCMMCRDRGWIPGLHGWERCPRCNPRPSSAQRDAVRRINATGSLHGRRLTIREMLDRERNP